MSNFTLKQQVTIPFLMPPDDHSPIWVKFLSPFIEDDNLALARKRRNSGEEQSRKPLVASVLDLNTNTKAKFIGNSVVVSSLTESFENDSYVGKCFQIKKLEKVKSANGNSYFGFEIFEIEATEPDTEASTSKHDNKTPSRSR